MKKFLVGFLAVFLISMATVKSVNAMTDDDKKAGFFLSSGTSFGQKYSSIGGFIKRITDEPLEGEDNFLSKYGGILYFGLEVLKPENFDHFTKGYTVYLSSCFVLNKKSWCQFYWGVGLGIGLRYNKLKEDMDDWIICSVPVGVRIGELSIWGNKLSLRIQTGPRIKTNSILGVNPIGLTWIVPKKGNFWHLEISLENRL